MYVYAHDYLISIMAELAPGIHLVDDSIGCNAYVIVDGGITLVDTGLRGNEKHIYGCIRKLGYAQRDIRRIIVTHAHLDHVNCLHRLKEDSGATVYAADGEADMVEGRRPLRAPGGAFGLLFAPLQAYYRYRPVHVDVRLADGDRIDVLGGLEVVMLPGHSEGNMGLYCPRHSLVFSSDTVRVLNGNPSAPSPRFTADMAGAIEAIGRLAGLRFDALLPGHGRPIMARASEMLGKLYGELKQTPRTGEQ